MNKMKLFTLAVGVFSISSQGAWASCEDIFAAVRANPTAITSAVGSPENGGYGLPMWVAAVDETSKICAVVNTAGSGVSIGNKSWLGSRIIAAQKANTANAFSLDGFSISTGNMYGLTLPGGSFYGVQFSNPVEGFTAYQGSPENYGNPESDPLIGKRIGGVNVFGGALALYVNNGSAKKKIGAIGVSGDTPCTDHVVAWKIRKNLGLDNVPKGFVTDYTPLPSFAIKGDELIIGKGDVANAYKQVSCAHNKINNPVAGAVTGVIIE